MEYRIHELKKQIRQRRIQICLCFLVISFVGFLIWNSLPSKTPTVISQPPVPPKDEETPPAETPIISDYAILKTYERQGKQYFTQGLTFKDANTLIESTGLYGKSVIHSLNIEDMSVIKESALDGKYFGEGCEIIRRGEVAEVYQLTWKEGKVLVWDLETLKWKRTLDLPKQIREGWGIAITPPEETIQSFYISDGSSNIYMVNPDTFGIIKKIEVKEANGKAQKNLNELEFINNKLWANIWGTSLIAVIDPFSGLIEYYIDLSGLKDLAMEKAKERGIRWQHGNSVLNGIAYDSVSDTLIVTGKEWPLMWEIKVNESRA